MKIIAKTKAVLISNKAETLVEVIVAFAVLTIVCVLLGQGMSYAQSIEGFAIEKTKACDEAMRMLQHTVTKGGSQAESRDPINDDYEVISLEIDGKKLLKIKKYIARPTERGKSVDYFYYVFDAKLE